MQAIIALGLITVVPAGVFLWKSPDAKRWLAFRLLASADADEERRDAYERRLAHWMGGAR